MAVEFDDGGGLVVGLVVGLGFDEAKVGVDSALAVEPEAEDGLVGLDGVNFGGEHVVEECVAVFACDFEGGHVWFVKDDSGFAEGGVFHVELAKGFDDWGLVGWRAVVEEECFCGFVMGLEGVICWHWRGW